MVKEQQYKIQKPLTFVPRIPDNVRIATSFEYNRKSGTWCAESKGYILDGLSPLSPNSQDIQDYHMYRLEHQERHEDNEIPSTRAVHTSSHGIYLR